ncbi:MAG: dimethylsulfonioproprionate lyase family protein [Rhodospirillales bacterium]
MKRCIEALRALCEWAVASDDECSPGYRRILDRVDWSGPRAETGKPNSLPVVEAWLEEAVQLCGDNPLGDLGRAIWEDRSTLNWFSMYEAYAGDPEIDTLRAGYGVVRLAGPSASWFAEDLTTAVTLQAPNVYYPPHAHKQREVYGVIGGKAEWQRGAEPWVLRSSGERIYHPSGVRHATRTVDEPLLAFASWLDDVHLKPVFVSG